MLDISGFSSVSLSEIYSEVTLKWPKNGNGPHAVWLFGKCSQPLHKHRISLCNSRKKGVNALDVAVNPLTLTFSVNIL